MRNLFILLSILFFNGLKSQSIIDITPSCGFRGDSVKVCITGQNTDFVAATWDIKSVLILGNDTLHGVPDGGGGSFDWITNTLTNICFYFKIPANAVAGAYNLFTNDTLHLSMMSPIDFIISAFSKDITANITQPTCVTPTGTIEVTSPLNTNLKYSNGGSFQSSPIFSGLNPGNYAITMLDTSIGCISPPKNFTVNTLPPNNTVSAASSTPTVCINTAITNITHTTTGATGIGAASGLPTGVSANWSGGTITISGTPNVTGAFNYSIPLTGGGCGTVNATGTITVLPVNTYSPGSSTPTVCINTAITNITHTTTGATGIGAALGLPSGVSANWSGGVITISGTPTTTGTFNYFIPLTGGCGSEFAPGTITVLPNNTVTAGSSVSECEFEAITNITHTTTGANGISNSGVSGANGLPCGVSASWSANTITISGTPNCLGAFNYSIPLTGGCGTVNASGTIQVFPPIIAEPASSYPTVCVNTAITNITHYTGLATGIGAASGLPSGVSASWAGGVITISGTPTTIGVFNYSIPLTGGSPACQTAYATGTITVLESTMNLNIFTTNSDCDSSNASAYVIPTGGAAPYTFYWDNGSTIDSTNNLFAGMHYLTVTDDNGCVKQQSFIVNNNSSPNISLNTIQPVLCAGNPTGAINIDVTGGATPYNYEWSTNATTQDINNLSKGVYEVTVTDANNCVSTEQFIVPGPNPIVFTTSVSYATCTMSNGSASVDTILGGIQPYSFLWSNSDTSQTVNSLSPGIYSVTVSDANGCSKTRYVEIHDNGAPTISVDNIIPATCGNTDGGVNITTSGTGNTFAWSNSTGNEDLTGVSSGTYQLTVTEPGGCQSFLSVVVPGETPNQQPICLITVNDTTNTNLIVWEKEVTTNIDHYNIYRESSAAGVYNLVHSQPYASLSQWTDSVASPMVRGWRYKISAVNNCGQESALSPLHKTIHLTINQGLPGSYNLIWDNYLGFTFPSFNIYRYTNAEGFVLINTLPSNLFSYTDNPPSVGGLYYIVEAVPPATCTSTLKAVNHNSTRSNKSNQSTSSTVTGIKDVIGENINIYPNPNSGSFNISGDILGSKIEVFNGLGQMVYNNSKLIENTLRIEGLSKGVYFLKVQNNNFIKTYKVVVE